MPSASMTTFEGRLYRAALALFPSGFRRDHGAETARDFDEACEEASRRRSAIWSLRWCMAIDLARTWAVQWIHTGLPVVAIASVFLALVVVAGLASLVQRVTVHIPEGIEHDDLVVILFMVEISVVLIAMTIFISLWVGRLMRPRRR